VDIGLERDAFLYVSEFMELGKIRTTWRSSKIVRTGASISGAAGTEAEAEARWEMVVQNSPPRRILRNPRIWPGRELPCAGGSAGESLSGNRADGATRRRRGGARPLPGFKIRGAGSETPREPQRTDFGPPPGYQPIILPGESISKYQRLAQNPVAPASEERAPEAQELR